MQLAAHAREADAVEVGEADVGQRGRDLLGVAQLAAAGGRHRVADVDGDPDRQVLVLFIKADQGLLEAHEHAPVEVADVVAGAVLAVVGEFEAAADLARLAFGALLAAEQPARDHLQQLELGQEGLAEQLVVGGGGGRGPLGLRALAALPEGQAISSASGRRPRGRW
ncbi:hypothetical protein OV079_03975 [Nannocystis pusilla]|uniref:Uncharacterized protein n=1 Tax=Nannocystis pusilla TaxID=889268 RepID=A0A9X3EIL7_9BACT|nr:hypothetical protein [Nannocystis pusilla]MCY1004742.1 hypothetical protein [Nannocystis pusilla]